MLLKLTCSSKTRLLVAISRRLLVSRPIWKTNELCYIHNRTVASHVVNGQNEKPHQRALLSILLKPKYMSSNVYDKHYEITSKNYRMSLTKGDVYLVDVREPNEIETHGCIMDSVNIPCKLYGLMFDSKFFIERSVFKMF